MHLAPFPPLSATATDKELNWLRAATQKPPAPPQPDSPGDGFRVLSTIPAEIFDRCVLPSLDVIIGTLGLSIAAVGHSTVIWRFCTHGLHNT